VPDVNHGGSDSDILPSWLTNPIPAYDGGGTFTPNTPQPSPDGPGRGPDVDGGVVVGPDPGPSTHPDVPDPLVFDPASPPPPDVPQPNYPLYPDPTVAPPSTPDPRPPLPEGLQREMRNRPDAIEWEYHDDGTILVFPEDVDSAVWGFWPRQGNIPPGWELLDGGDYPRIPGMQWQDTRTAPRTPLPTEPTPGQPPVENPRNARPERPGPAGGGWSDEVYRREIERIREDIARRFPDVERSVWGIVSGIGRRIGGVIGGIMIPGELGSGELTPEQVRNIERALEQAERERAVGDRMLQEVYDRHWPQPIELPPPQMPPPLPMPEPRPVALPVPDPVVSGAPAPSPTPAPAPVRTPRPTRPARRAWPPIISGLLGRLLTPGGTIQQDLSRFMPQELMPDVPTPTTTPTPVPVPNVPTTPNPGTPATPSQPTPLTPFEPQVLGSSPPRVRTRTRQRECECDPPKRKRQKRRKCRTRANVVWASGPKKGKFAGTRCIDWET